MSEDDKPGYRGPQNAAPYPLSRLSAPITLVDAAREIEHADQWIASTASARLSQIAAQMQALRAQAEAVLQKAREDAELHRAEARFTRLPGKTYHLYERADGSRYWSMLSPEEWGGTPPHAFVASYRLEADRSFSRVDGPPDPHAPPRLDLDDWVKGKLLP
jgi:alkylation response protein AidB-like acyl-CoA dehydrogenase